MIYRHFVAASLLACASSVFANPPTAEAKLLSAAPKIDGTIAESEWSEAASFEGLVDAQTNASSADGAKYWLGYDAKYIYVAVRALDREPSKIRAVEYRTNVSFSGDDSVTFLIDPSGSMDQFSSFQINPRGATNIQLSGGRAAKREWAGEFVASGRVTKDGYEIEARIPWEVLAAPGGRKQDVRFNFNRFIARQVRQYTYTFTANGQRAETPIWHDVPVPKLQVDRSIKLLPYVYTGADRHDGLVFNSGLDLKSALTDNIQLVGSINPDFRNIENQILSLDFSRFERLARETRPFFQEGSQYIETAIFASQRIPNFDLGINSYGRLSDKTNFGLIETDDFGVRNNLVANVSHQSDPTTSFRASAASLSEPGLDNEAYLLRVSKDYGPYNLFVRQMGSQDSVEGTGSDSSGFLTYQAQGLIVSGGYSRRSDNFRPRLGFFPERDFQGPALSVNYNRQYTRGTWNDWGASTDYLVYDHIDGSRYRRQSTGALFGTLKNGLAIVGSYDFSQFEGSDDHLYSISLGIPRGNPYRNVSVGYTVGDQAGFDYTSLQINSAYRFGQRLQVNGRYQSVHLDRDYNQFILSANYDLNAYQSISGRLVQTGSDIGAYAAFRKAGNKGAEYYLIAGSPNSRTFEPSVILKVTFPFRLG